MKFAPITRSRLTIGIAASIALLILALQPLSLALEPTVVYTGEVQLPVALYSSDGTLFERGKLHVEVQSEKGGCVLALSRSADPARVVTGVADNGKSAGIAPPTLPLIGTVYLYEVEKPATGDKELKRPADEKPDVTFAEHLGARPWKAALRVYGYPQPGPAEVLFVLEEQRSPGEWIRTDFTLFRTKPRQ